MVETMLSVFLISVLTFVVTLGLAYLCRCLCGLNCSRVKAEAVSGADRRSVIGTGAGSVSGSPSVTISPLGSILGLNTRIVDEVQSQRLVRPRSHVALNAPDRRATFYAAAESSSNESLCFTGDRKRLSLEIEKLSEKIEHLKLKKTQLMAVKGRWDQEIFV